MTSPSEFLAVKRIATIRAAARKGDPIESEDDPRLQALRTAEEAVKTALGPRASTFGGLATAWVNEFAPWPLEWVERFAKHKDTPVVARAAAMRVLRSIKPGFDGGKEFDRVCDRTAGKPTQSVSVRHEPTSTAAELLAETRRLAGVTVVRDVIDLDAPPQIEADGQGPDSSASAPGAETPENE